MDLVLNILIALFVVIDAMVALAVVDQKAAIEDSQPLLAAPPATTAPVATTVAPGGVEPGVEGLGGAIGAAVNMATVENLQGAMVAARSLQVQNDRPIEASDLSAAVPGLTFVNGLTAAGDGVIGVSSNADGFLLLTQNGSGGWVCADTDVAGVSALGTSDDREAVASLAGCKRNPR